MTTETAENSSAAMLAGNEPAAGEQQQGAQQGGTLFNESAKEGQPPSDTEPGKPAEAKIDGLQVPGADAKPEEWDAFYKQLGRPEKAEDYKLPVPEGDKGEFAKAISPMLHAAGLTQKQAETLAKGWNEYVSSQMKAMQEQQAQQAQEQQAAAQVKNQAEAEALKKEWGADFDANKELAVRAKNQFFPKDQADTILDALDGAIGPKATLLLLHSIGKGLAEDSAAGLGNPGKGNTQSTGDKLFDKS